MKLNKILYITTDTSFLKLTDAGGNVVENSHLKILKLLGYEVQILHINTLLFSAKTNPRIIKTKTISLFDESEVQLDEIQLCSSPSSRNIISRAKRIFTDVANYYYPFVNKRNTVFLENYITASKVNLIWCQWFYPGLICAKLKINIPVIYVHHDWQYKLLVYKKEKGIRRSFLRYAKRKIEKTFIKKLTATICLSYTDYLMLKKTHKYILYLPVTYDFKPIEKINLESESPSLVHLGNLNTTANRVGLREFMEFSWKEIKKRYPSVKLEIIGREAKNNEVFMDMLKNDSNIIYSNYVENLDAVMHPYDVHIIPWNKDTGTRTRIPLIFRYKQCVVAMQEGVKNIKDIKHMHNSIIAKSWKNYTKCIIELIENKTLRKQISENGYETYKTIYTHSLQTQAVQNFIQKVTSL